MTSFKDAFWEDPRVLGGSTYKNGPQTLFTRLKQGTTECDDLLEFIRERAMIEERYSTALRGLATRTPFKTKRQSEEGTSLARAFDGLLKETSSLADVHGQIAQDLTYDTVRILQHFSEEHRDIVFKQINRIKNELSSLGDEKSNALNLLSIYNKAVVNADRLAVEFQSTQLNTSLSQTSSLQTDRTPTVNSKSRSFADDSEVSLNDPLNFPSEAKKIETHVYGLSSNSQENQDNSNPEHNVGQPANSEFMFLLGSLSVSRDELAYILSSLKSNLPQHSIKYGLLGNLHGLIRGDQLVAWWKTYLPENSYTTEEIIEICQYLMDQNYLRYMGKGQKFVSSSGAYYQWKKQAHEFSPTLVNKETTSENKRPDHMESVSSFDSFFHNISNRQNSSSKASWILGSQPSKKSLDKAESRVYISNEKFKNSVISFEAKRMKTEESLVSRPTFFSLKKK
ncbi:hypothetical protein BB560_004991 [Smittium megazygosporum]|uniref:F-BAR domain-containing protein n=1 Tax=Smittium megazygosporum TaxID=133381 RepID=A0A2T9Z7P4_9FUNG|nr:hypothetical protein BB560_004991 [Smittium megazygosporum]